LIVLYQATFIVNAFIDLNNKPFVAISSSISKSSCNPSQNLAELPKYLLNLKAVSAVILRLPLIISEILVWGISISFASLYAVILKGIRNSSERTLPG
jgi:hypothetical protein